MTPGVQPLHHSRMVQPDIVVMALRRHALQMGHRRAEDLARFQLIESGAIARRDPRTILIPIDIGPRPGPSRVGSAVLAAGRGPATAAP